jgi:hypothetical protein
MVGETAIGRVHQHISQQTAQNLGRRANSEESRCQQTYEERHARAQAGKEISASISWLHLGIYCLQSRASRWQVQ